MWAPGDTCDEQQLLFFGPELALEAWGGQKGQVEGRKPLGPSSDKEASKENESKVILTPSPGVP